MVVWNSNWREHCLYSQSVVWLSLSESLRIFVKIQVWALVQTSKPHFHPTVILLYSKLKKKVTGNTKGKSFENSSLEKMALVQYVYQCIWYVDSKWCFCSFFPFVVYEFSCWLRVGEVARTATRDGGLWTNNQEEVGY